MALGIAGCGSTKPRSHGGTGIRLASCKVTQLQLRNGPSFEGMTQQTPFAFALRNVSGTSCSMRGCPRIALLGRGGTRVQFRYRDRGDEELTGSSPTTVRLKPGADAFFAINKNSCVGPGTPVTRLVFGLPAGAGNLRVALPREPELTHCKSGDTGHAVDISPVERTACPLHDQSE
jgi:hypothetical protein